MLIYFIIVPSGALMLYLRVHPVAPNTETLNEAVSPLFIINGFGVISTEVQSDKGVIVYFIEEGQAAPDELSFAEIVHEEELKSLLPSFGL